MKRILISLIITSASVFCFSPLISIAQERGTLVEKKVAALPTGPIFWRLENFSTLAGAQAATGPTGLAAEAGGKVWLFTFGPTGGSSTGGIKVVEIGPIAPVVATGYLLRITQAVGAPGSKRGVHTHPGSEAFFVLAAEQSLRTP